MKMLLTIAAMLPMVGAAGAAMAGTYTGNWPLSVTHARYIDGNYCLTLTDDGSLGWPHSGAATIAGEPYGTFQVINGSLVATIEEQGGSGQNAGLVFIAATTKGKLAKGNTDMVYGGEEFDSGAVVFGKKGGC